MAITRRALLQSFALAPALQLLNSNLAHALMSAGPQANTYILLHGMFFMAFEGNNLVVATPQHLPHHFQTRDHGGPLQTLPAGDINLTSLEGGAVQCFPSDVIQFSASSMQRVKPVLSSATKFQTRITLPFPKAIFAYRTDTADHFLGDPGKNVTQSILSFAGPRLGTITCLEYGPGSNPFVRSYYAEHPTRVGSTEVNLAFDAARDQGFCGPGFDLTILPGYVPDPYRDPDASLPPGVLGDDEASLEEISATTSLYRPMFETHSRATNMQAPRVAIHPDTQNTAGRNAERQHRVPFNVDVASCPQLGITYL